MLMYKIVSDSKVSIVQSRFLVKNMSSFIGRITLIRSSFFIICFAHFKNDSLYFHIFSSK